MFKISDGTISGWNAEENRGTDFDWQPTHQGRAWIESKQDEGYVQIASLGEKLILLFLIFGKNDCELIFLKLRQIIYSAKIKINGG